MGLLGRKSLRHQTLPNFLGMFDGDNDLGRIEPKDNNFYEDATMRKSPFATDLKGPPPVREWHLMDPSKDGSPCVIKRRFGYWQTNLKRLANAETKLAEYRKRKRQHDADIDALRARIENRKAWVAFSVATLRNSIRFARARITPESEDYALLMRLCPHCHLDTQELLAQFQKPFVTARLENGKTQLRCEACLESKPYVSVKRGVTRRPRGRLNKKFHKELLHYDKVLDQFLLAKKAVAGCSISEEAMVDLLALTKKAIGHFKNQSAREADDAEQGAILGLMEAARKFDPNPEVSKFAKFTTYASLWIRRRSQARKTSHCKPGVAIIKGKHVSTARIEMSDGEEGHADRFHPGTERVNHALQMDVADALASLDEQTRDLVTDHLIHKRTLVELSERSGLTVSQIRTLINRGKAKLAQRLAAHRE